MNEDRADQFLRLIRRSQRGKLKIYLGYCAGVGKTYQMLQDGRRLREKGMDVVIGLVETHGRKETAALVEGLEQVPLRRTIYHGIEMTEMDLDAILARHPSVVLVDELAHTNIPGSRNAKRYQDIDELLAAGIHIISTLNIQHLESLYETIERATNVKVWERVPDRVVLEADQIVNVDVSTEDLRQRLEAGKVYTPERIDAALSGFFRPTNLEQLREITLRELASQIDSRRRDFAVEKTPSSPDQIMTCLSSRGPNSEALLRYTSRLAGRLNRNWYAVYVQTAAESPATVDAGTLRILSNTLVLAEQLGATTFTYKGEDVVGTVLQFAKEYRVGHIVIGAPGRPIPFWRRLLGETSIVERLIAESKNITLTVLDTRSAETDSFPVNKAARTGSSAEQRTENQPIILQNSVLLSTPRVVLWDGLREKTDAIRHLLAECCRDLPQLQEAEIWVLLEKREQQGSTFIGEDIAFPHIRVEGLTAPHLAIGIAKDGVREPSTGKIAHIMFLLLSPASAPDQHIKNLAQISRMARDSQWRKNILEAESITEISKIIQAWNQD